MSGQSAGNTESHLLMGFIAMLLVVIFAGGQALIALRDAVSTASWVSHTHEVLVAIERLQSRLNGLTTEHRSYLLTGDASYLDDWKTEEAALRRELQSLRSLAADDKYQLGHVAELEILITDRLQLFDQNLDIFRSHGFEAARQRVSAGAGRRISNRIAEVVEHMTEQELSLLRQRETDAAGSAHKALWVNGVLTLLALVGFTLLWWKMRREIQNRRASEATVRASEQLLTQVLNLLPVAVFVADASGKLTRTNPAAREIWAGERWVGIDRYGEYVGWWSDTGKPVAAEDWALARAFRSGQSIRDELVDILCFDGSRKTISNSASPIRSETGELVGGIAINVDVTTYINTERQLRAAVTFEETYRRALSLFSESFDREQVLSSLLALLAERHAFPVSTFYRFDEWRGCYVCEVTHGLPATVPREFAPGEGVFGQAVQSSRYTRVDTRELTLQTGIADFSPAEVLILPIDYQNKRLAVLVLASVRPLSDTDYSFLERIGSQISIALNNLRQYADLKMLAAQLRATGEEIATKNQQLQEADRMKSEFLANMSHELRTPLNAIIGFAEALKEGLAGTLPQQQLEFITEIFNSGTHLLSLINDILDLSKVEAGRMTLELGHVDIKALVNGSLQILREKALAHQLRLTADIEIEEDDIVVDERKLKQILYNLLSNAVKFTPDGGSVHVTVRQTPPAANENPEFHTYVDIAVKDTGIGISPENQTRLFQAFSQIDSTLARRYEGTGLGLMIVKRLTELQGGTVSLTSATGQGSTFRVRLPWRSTATSAPSVAAAALSADEASGSEAMPSVLVIEDSDSAAELMRVQLESAGFRVARADTAQSALAMAHQHVPDIITLDILLPDRDGWDLLVEFKRDPLLASVPVVIVSIVADSDRGLSLGAAHVLQKPVSREDLLHALKSTGLAHPLRGCTVLVVDDDPKAVQLMGANLQSIGCHMVAAYGGQEAIDSARRSPPDLIVLDLLMPEVSGFDVVEALKESPDTARIPILVVTSLKLSTADRARLNGDVTRIMEKSSFNHGRFLSEVQRAMIGKRK